MGTGPVRDAVTIVACAAGLLAGQLYAVAAVRETGFTGHGAGLPVIARHAVILPKRDALGLPQEFDGG